MAAKQEKPFGEELLRSILADGSEKNNEQIGLAASYFGSRVEGKRLQLANQDRRRPVAGIDTLGHHQIEKRNKRILKKRRQSTHTPHKKLKNEKVAMSRRERQRLGLENWDENITYESLLPIHKLWIEYIHRLLGLVDENGHTQINQFHHTKGSQGEKEEVTVNPSVINTFQTNIVKADLCGALVRVSRALNPSLVGIEGLVAKETESTIVLVTKSLHLKAKKSRKLVKVIPKHNTVFNLQIPLPMGAVPSQPSSAATTTSTLTWEPLQMQLLLYGNQLCNNMQTRATKKFKARKTIDL